MSTVTQQLSVGELSALYDRIYDIADRLIKKYNPCNICIEGKKAKCAFHCYYINDTRYLCCTGCKYWYNGCTVKCLRCKLHLCSYAERKNKNLHHRFEKLKAFTYNYLEVSFYTSKEDWLKRIISRRKQYDR